MCLLCKIVKPELPEVSDEIETEMVEVQVDQADEEEDLVHLGRS